MFKFKLIKRIVKRIRLNHEIWAVCPVCGYEYDMRIWGDTCPECARRKMKDINARCKCRIKNYEHRRDF